MTIRIYVLSKQLNVDSKDILDAVRRLKIEGKSSPFHSLTSDEVEQVKNWLHTRTRTSAHHELSKASLTNGSDGSMSVRISELATRLYVQPKEIQDVCKKLGIIPFYDRNSSITTVTNEEERIIVDEICGTPGFKDVSNKLIKELIEEELKRKEQEREEQKRKEQKRYESLSEEEKEQERKRYEMECRKYDEKQRFLAENRGMPSEEEQKRIDALKRQNRWV